MTSEIAIAGHIPIGPPRSIESGRPGMRISSSPSRRYAYVYAVYSAMAPVAKFTTPELRYVRTTASAKAPKTAPLPSPSSKNTRCCIVTPFLTGDLSKVTLMLDHTATYVTPLPRIDVSHIEGDYFCGRLCGQRRETPVEYGNVFFVTVYHFGDRPQLQRPGSVAE